MGDILTYIAASVGPQEEKAVTQAQVDEKVEDKDAVGLPVPSPAPETQYRQVVATVTAEHHNKRAASSKIFRKGFEKAVPELASIVSPASLFCKPSSTEMPRWISQASQ